MTEVLTPAETGSIGGLQARFVDVNGIRTRYYETGEGNAEVMVLCHGGGWQGASSANTWTRNLPGLGERFHCFAADKLASGMTDNPKSDDDYTIEAQTAHMYDFIRTMGIEKCHMVGQSRGGYQAARITLEHPELVKTLVVVDSGTLAPEIGSSDERYAAIDASLPEGPPAVRARAYISSFSYNLEGNITDEFMAAYMFMDTHPKSLATKERWKNGGEELFNRTLAAQKEQTHQWIREGRLQVPTLIYWGRDDRTALLAEGVQLFEMIADTNRRTRMIVVNQARHHHYREYPEEWNWNVIRFCTMWD